MWNNILFFACIWFCACSTMDPEIPDYESLENDPLPIATIKSASRVFLREATLSIVLSPTSSRIPRRLYLCYGKDSDRPDTLQLKVDLLPLYKDGTIDVKITNLLPATLYYCRVYAETRNEKGYSGMYLNSGLLHRTRISLGRKLLIFRIERLSIIGLSPLERIFIFRNAKWMG